MMAYSIVPDCSQKIVYCALFIKQYLCIDYDDDFDCKEAKSVVML